MTRENRRHSWWAAAIVLTALWVAPGTAAAAPEPDPLLGAGLKAQAAVLDAMGLRRPTQANADAPQSPDNFGPSLGDFSTPLVAGTGHTCTVGPFGDIWCWGANDAGQLGDGSTDDSSAPVAVELNEGFVFRLAAGAAHTCAVTFSQVTAAWCWGANGEGQLGDGTTTDRHTPVEVTEDVADIAAGAEHTCVIREDDTVACWGRNDVGQLGIGTAGAAEATPQPVPGLADIADIAAAGNTTCAVDHDGSAWCWGSDADGQVGDGNGSTGTPQPTPVAVDLTDVPEEGFREIAVGLRHACAVTWSEELYCWGSDADGQLGTTGTAADESAPVAADTDGQRFLSVDAGADSTCAVIDNGELLCWGANADGQLGTGDNTGRTTPVAADLSGVAASPIIAAILGSAEPMVTAVTLGDTHGCLATLTPAVYCWGANADGQLGDGTTQGADVPQLTRLAPGPATDVRVTAGDAELDARWAAPDDLGAAPVQSYAALALSDSADLFGCGDGTDTACTLEDLENDREYTVFVGAATAAGISYTAGVSATPVATGEGGGLPVSGPDVALYLGSAAGLIAVGLAIMAFARRRRV